MMLSFLRLNYLIVFLFGMIFGTSLVFSYDMHGDVQDQAVQTNLAAMAAFQVHYTNFMYYTINIDTPGFLEQGVYNTRRADGHVKYVPFYRFRPGPPIQTNRPLDFYLDAAGRGFYVVKLPGGALAFTRDGRFRLDSNRRLVTLTGYYPVLGEEGEIYFPEGAEQDISISRAGMLYIAGQEVARLRIAVFQSFKEMQTLQTVNGSFFTLTRALETLDGHDHYKVEQGWLEQNNVLKAINGDIMMARNGWEMNQKTATLINKTLGTAAGLAAPN